MFSSPFFLPTVHSLFMSNISEPGDASTSTSFPQAWPLPRWVIFSSSLFYLPDSRSRHLNNIMNIRQINAKAFTHNADHIMKKMELKKLVWKTINSMLSQMKCTGRDQGVLGCNTRWVVTISLSYTLCKTISIWTSRFFFMFKSFTYFTTDQKHC